jgi:hypothetical protein
MYPSSQERNLPLHFHATNLGRTITQIGLVLFALLGMVFVFSTSHANETQVEVIDSWVEDGFLFHVAFESEPSNANCALNDLRWLMTPTPSMESTRFLESRFGIPALSPTIGLKRKVKPKGLKALAESLTPVTFKPSMWSGRIVRPLMALCIHGQTNCPITLCIDGRFFAYSHLPARYLVTLTTLHLEKFVFLHAAAPPLRPSSA